MAVVGSSFAATTACGCHSSAMLQSVDAAHSRQGLQVT
jgi:hypothetical protein